MNWGEALFFVFVACAVIAFVATFAVVLIPLAVIGGGLWFIFSVCRIGSG